MLQSRYRPNGAVYTRESWRAYRRTLFVARWGMTPRQLALECAKVFTSTVLIIALLV